MKKLYVIITPTIKLVGGAQIYSLNKLRYYRKEGWDTMLLHANLSGPIVIDEMRQYKDCYVDEFKFIPCLLSEKRVLNLIDKVIHKYKLKNYASIVIESHNIETSTWGELIAERIDAKHLVYLLSEFPVIKPRTLFEFFLMKYKRNELAGIAKTSINSLFRGYMEISDTEKYCLSAICSNSIGPMNISKMPTFDKYDFLLASVGRMEKPYLLDAIDEILIFAKKNKDKKIALLFIGDGSSTIKKKIMNKLSHSNNIQCKITGPIYPIPINLIQSPNLFFGVAGSCFVSQKIGKLTVSFDVNDHQSIGFLGITTMSTIYRKEDEPPKSFSKLLEEALIEKKYKESCREGNTAPIVEVDFAGHELFINKSSKRREYYDILKTHLTIKEYLKKIMISILGVNISYLIKAKL